ncbi:polyadenylate-binding protein 7, partial [Tanacetum coccineum]
VGIRFKIGSLGFFRPSFPTRLNLCWKALSMLLGGRFGGSYYITPYFENLSYDSKGHYVNVGEKLKILNLVISMIALSGYTEGTNVYVDNIDVDVTEDLLRENFNHCGTIT